MLLARSIRKNLKWSYLQALEDVEYENDDVVALPDKLAVTGPAVILPVAE